jgi:hypothetical protein
VWCAGVSTSIVSECLQVIDAVQFNTWVIQEEPVSALLPVGFFKCDVPECRQVIGAVQFNSSETREEPVSALLPVGVIKFNTSRIQEEPVSVLLPVGVFCCERPQVIGASPSYDSTRGGGVVSLWRKRC